MPLALKEFLAFGLKQAWACLFAGLILVAILVSRFIWQDHWTVARYDALLVFALIVQVLLLHFKLETTREAAVIFLFHMVGLGMEVFKTHVGSWVYPEQCVMSIGGVPLFTGFMYSCVGSYMCRVMHVLDLRFSHYPKLAYTMVLATAIYLNFFTHHYMWDMRWLLMALVVVLWGRSWLYFRPLYQHYRMPVVFGFFLTACFIWIAENIGTFGRIWLYPGQQVWQPVGIAKLGSWFLLMIVSCVLVTLVNRPRDFTKEL